MVFLCASWALIRNMVRKKRENDRLLCVSRVSITNMAKTRKGPVGFRVYREPQLEIWFGKKCVGFREYREPKLQVWLPRRKKGECAGISAYRGY